MDFGNTAEDAPTGPLNRLVGTLAADRIHQGDEPIDHLRVIGRDSPGGNGNLDTWRVRLNDMKLQAAATLATNQPGAMCRNFGATGEALDVDKVVRRLARVFGA